MAQIGERVEEIVVIPESAPVTVPSEPTQAPPVKTPAPEKEPVPVG